MNELSLDKSLQAYRVLHTPAEFSWKQHYVKQQFSSCNIMKCPIEEKKEYSKRLTESNICICKNIKQKVGKVANLLTLLNIIINKSNENIAKMDRAIVFGSYSEERPIGRKAFDLWNGLQVFDIDIKDRKLAEEFKVRLFNRLKKYNWFFGISFSSSGKSLHVYTKIQVSEDDHKDPLKKKLLYLTNFRHKYSFIYLACMQFIEELGLTKENVIKYMDLAMFKPQQGAFIGYDPEPFINSGFFEDFIYVNFDNVEDMGHPDVDWVTYPDLKELFKRWEWFEDKEEDFEEVKVEDAPALEVDTHCKIHYKHFERWRLANTLVKLYGVKQGYNYLRMICSADTTDKELQGDCRTAAQHDKPVDQWAVNRLNNIHGFKIKLNIQEETPEEESDLLCESVGKLDNPTIIRESPNTKEFYIKSNEYLGNIYGSLLDNIGRITLIEAGAGTGKTEMVKMLADMGKKVMMIMPFTSTLKAKVENVKNWYVSYGNRKVRFDKEPCVALTLDKFAKLNLMEIKESEFEYIFLDESHLLFQSEYRPVMPKVIEMIRNTEVPIIMMSGTPVGETLFFPGIVHLKVIKEDLRKKSIEVNLVNRPADSMYYMTKAMAKDIAEGRRILFPTNKGTLFKEEVEAAVNYFLETDHTIFKPAVVNYYKKANIGEQFMDDVNLKKSITNTDILLCSNYLSVGVDILDKYEFSIYFNETWMPQEIEQFANRLRGNNLYVHLYIPKNDAEGNSLGIAKYKAINLQLNEDEIKNCHAVLRLCNAMIERNPVEYKYNSLISSIINNNKFVEYNEVENKYYLNEIAYKTIYFERKYRDYVEQLPVLIKGMMYYGYQYTSNDLSSVTVNTKSFSQAIHQAFSECSKKNTGDIEELMEMITEDRLSIYKSVMNGEWEIKKGEEWSEDPEKRIITVKNIEMFEKVVPLYTSMSKMFPVNSIAEIFEYCRNKQGGFNFAAIKRIKTLANIVYNNKHQRLDLPIKEFMTDVYDFVDAHKAIPRPEIEQFVCDYGLTYAQKESSARVIIERSPETMETINNTFMNIFKCLVNIGKPDKHRNCKMEKVELMWKQHEEGLGKQYVLQDFLDSMIDISEIDGSEALLSNDFEEVAE